MGKNKKLIWYLYPSYLLITLISLGAVTWYASSSIKDFYLDRTARDLKARVLLVTKQIQRHLIPPDKKGIDLLCKDIGSRGSTRITVILPSGKVIGDSEEDAAKMDNHADRPEIIQALTEGQGISTRYSRTLEKDMMYVALPVGKGSEIVGLIRAAVPVDAIDTAIGNIQQKIAIGGLFMAALAALLSLLVSRRITRPIAQIQRWAEAIDRGEFRSRPQVMEPEEIGTLSTALNRMAADLREQLNALTRQRNEMETVLSSMNEGVIALDLEEQVLRLNPAAGEMLGCTPSEAKGRSIHEVVRNTALYDFVTESLSDNGPSEKDKLLSWGDERFFNAQSTTLRDASGSRIGALIVLNDFTRIRKLENIRRDFVANVSHEIKTPITAIKGSVETLRDGAIRRPEDADRFLGIIEKHVNRLEVIIEDLLSLSRIEQERDGQGIELIERDVAEVLQNAIQLCGVLAAAKKINVDLSCDKDIALKMDASLLEKAVVNLLNNAITYSPEGSVIRVNVTQGKNETRIAVRDPGCGISKEHLPRVFERFYRIDKARSRQLGGTGLGLAIVKHIAEAHTGRVTVESTPGKGSTFTIHLPMASSLSDHRNP